MDADTVQEINRRLDRLERLIAKIDSSVCQEDSDTQGFKDEIDDIKEEW